MDEALRRQVEEWSQQDPDPGTRRELEGLLEAGDEAELADRFSGMLQFGTAGLRGILGGGPNRMNRVVVARATAGLCAYVKEHVPEAAARGICIGFDGRHMSLEFAEDVAAIVAGFGVTARVFAERVPTPLLAFACRHTNAAAGIVITASHNPPAYNGYKVYWENAAQIIPPIDQAIAAAIEAAPKVEDIPRLDRDQAQQEGLRVELERSVDDAYLEGIRTLRVHPESDSRIGIAYTALHGVGQRFVLPVLAEAGGDPVHPVPEQGEPDPDFPTVSFPNPEEQGAMDLVLALADEHGDELVLANDPDADRLAAAVRQPEGGYRMFTGNELGCLLAHYLLSEGEANGDGQRPACSRDAASGPLLVINTIVSSPMLGAIAEAHGARFEQTLTGFKWIANRAMELEREAGCRFVMGYEEALGYTVGSHVRDKDGIGTAAVFAEMTAYYRAQGKSLLDVLEDCWRRYGMFLSRQVSVVHEGPQGAARIRGIMDGAFESPPSRIAELDVTAVQDLRAQRRTKKGGDAERIALPPADVLVLELEHGHRVMLRPSGTEPKIKYYIDVRIDMGEGEPVSDAHARGDALLEALAEDLRAQVE